MGKLFLHIGRNKAGSKTLQAAWLGNLDRLRAAGVSYALFGQNSPPGEDLPSFAWHGPLIDHVRDHPAAVLVSHEGLCCFDPVFAAAMAADVATLDMGLLFYVRPYREWAVSSYGYDVRIGWWRDDVDAYLARLGDKVSFWPALRVWGEAIGWDRVRVRSLHPADLVGGDLAQDGMAAVGAAPPAHDLARHNATQSWVVVEVARFLAAALPDTGFAIDRPNAAALALQAAVDEAVQRAVARTGEALPRIDYLSATQSEQLRDLYNADLDRLAALTGRRLHDDDAAALPREAVPSAAQVPARLMAVLCDELGTLLARPDAGVAIDPARWAAFQALGQARPGG